MPFPASSPSGHGSKAKPNSPAIAHRDSSAQSWETHPIHPQKSRRYSCHSSPFPACVGVCTGAGGVFTTGAGCGGSSGGSVPAASPGSSPGIGSGSPAGSAALKAAGSPGSVAPGRAPGSIAGSPAGRPGGNVAPGRAPGRPGKPESSPGKGSRGKGRTPAAKLVAAAPGESVCGIIGAKVRTTTGACTRVHDLDTFRYGYVSK